MFLPVGTLQGSRLDALVIDDTLAGTEVLCIASVPYLKAKTKFKWQAVYF